ncbi:hypothetical protein Ciccas_014432 [Cichlidogyrus casuarinus]|uniref:C2H2-type domain-containing protein n=1 Tax=Cichlidogyrus casuarinus TaxID=1844966 RepID=A0ABD2PID5_9PLAT
MFVAVCKWKETATKKMRDHYLEQFLVKDTQHIKTINYLSILPNFHVYWCKICCTFFEKSWSLVQHLTDKASLRQKSDSSVAHYEALEALSGTISGFDLGLTNLTKMQSDVTSLLTKRIQFRMSKEDEILFRVFANLNYFPEDFDCSDAMKSLELYD